MENNKTFYIVYYSNKDKKHITRRGKHDEKSRYGTSKKGEPYYVYYDLDAHGYRTASKSWKVRPWQIKLILGFGFGIMSCKERKK